MSSLAHFWVICFDISAYYLPYTLLWPLKTLMSWCLTWNFWSDFFSPQRQQREPGLGGVMATVTSLDGSVDFVALYPWALLLFWAIVSTFLVILWTVQCLSIKFISCFSQAVVFYPLQLNGSPINLLFWLLLTVVYLLSLYLVIIFLLYLHIVK